MSDQLYNVPDSDLIRELINRCAGSIDEAEKENDVLKFDILEDLLAELYKIASIYEELSRRSNCTND